MQATGRVALTLAIALAAALLCEALHTPLPWMIGPLLASAACSLAGLPLLAPTALRNAGQWVIGTALGLYFTPQVVAVLPALAPAIAAGVAWALLMGYGFYRWLWRSCAGQPGVNRATAFFAAAIGGASEMAILAERHDGRVDLVAAAHSLRLMLVVVIIPFAFQAAGVQGADPSAPGMQAVSLPRLALLAALTLLGVGALQRAGLPNPWVLGALAVTMVLTAFDVQLSALPNGVTQCGQLFIGIALGTRFTPTFAQAAPRWLAAVTAGTLAMILLSAGFAWLLAHVAGLHPATVLLGTSPGGIAEMCITAKVLQLGVPVVTAFHVVRYVAVLLATRPFFRLESARH